MSVVLLLIAAMGAATVTHRIPVYSDQPLAFSVDIPALWGYSDQGFESYHYRSVRVCANNRGLDSLRVVTWWRSLANGVREGTSGSEAFEHELAPGTVYFDLATLSGPPSRSRPYAWSAHLGPSVRITAAAETRLPWEETDGFVLYRVHFVRWGWRWEALIVARKPFDARDVDAAFDILTSLRFPDLPVYDPQQAVEVVIPSLPVEMRPQPNWFEECGGMFHYGVDADTTRSGFKITFSVLDGTEDKRVVRSASYYVGRSGEVTALRKERN